MFWCGFCGDLVCEAQNGAPGSRWPIDRSQQFSTVWDIFSPLFLLLSSLTSGGPKTYTKSGDARKKAFIWTFSESSHELLQGFPATRVRNTTEIVQKTIVRMNFVVILGGTFWVDFPPPKITCHRLCEIITCHKTIPTCYSSPLFL